MTQVVIVGVGPAGMMAGLLFARPGVADRRPQPSARTRHLHRADAAVAVPELRRAREGRRYPSFNLRMETEGVALVETAGRITGVWTGRGKKSRRRWRSWPTGADRSCGAKRGCPLNDLGAPIELFRFRVPKAPTPDNRTQGLIAGGEMVVTIDRGDYFQCARVLREARRS